MLRSPSGPHALDLIANREVHLVIATPLGKSSRADEAEIRRAAIRKGIPVLSTLSAAAAAVRGIRAFSDTGIEVRTLQEFHRTADPDSAGDFFPGGRGLLDSGLPGAGEPPSETTARETSSPRNEPND